MAEAYQHASRLRSAVRSASAALASQAAATRAMEIIAAAWMEVPSWKGLVWDGGCQIIGFCSLPPSLGLPLARLSCAISREVMVFVPLLVIAVSSWTPSLPSNGGGLIQRQRLRPLMSGASEQDEIAELESRLANLKKAQEEELAAAALAEAEASGKRIVEATEGFDPTTLSNRKRVATSSGPAPEELLSEAWKEIEEESRDGEGGLPLASLGGGLALLVGLFVFAQVPIGQELDPATYNTANVPLESSAKIRQRYESVGAVD
jgi:hypothetical protein